MKKAELVFIPAPFIGHIVSALEFAKCLLDRDDRLSITILVIFAGDIQTRLQSLVGSGTRIRCIKIPPAALWPATSSKSPAKLATDYIASNRPLVEQAIEDAILSDDSMQLAGIVIDLLCTSMIDVAHKFNVPSYLYFASGAAFLGFMLHLPVHHNKVGSEFGESDGELIVPSYVNPVPMNVMPEFAFDKDGYSAFLSHGTRFQETKGYIVNSFAELELHAINSMMTKPAPTPVYTVGPLLDHSLKDKSIGSEIESKWNDIMNWLDDQPISSVVFLCFGSRGCFDAAQLEQLAIALEKSGQRFLWSIRRPTKNRSFELPTEYQNVEEVLPAGFLERTCKRGKVCGWAPQVEVLAHSAVGGFVSHCGWNSVLESLWYGVPIATWPLYAEQQINAFQLVRDMGLAVELKMDYRLDIGGEMVAVMADVIEGAINWLMDDSNKVRMKVKEMSDKCKKAVADGGSSYAHIGRLIEDFLENKSQDK